MLYDPKRDIGVTGRVLLYAADLLERHGWCQGEHRNERGEHCAKGAINAAAHELGLPYETVNAHALHALDCLRRHLGCSVLKWNDALGMTREQVVGTLRALAFVIVPLRRGR